MTMSPVPHKTLWECKEAAMAFASKNSGKAIWDEGIAFNNSLISQGVDPCLLELSDAESEFVDELTNTRLEEARDLANSVQTKTFEQQMRLRAHYKAIRLGTDPVGIDSDVESTGSLKNYIPPSDDDEESDDDYGDVRLVPKVQYTVRPPRLTYSIETLKSLIPGKPEFDRLKQSLGMQATVYRYDVSTSNRTFKRRYFFKNRKVFHGPKVPVIIRGNDLIPIIGKKKALGPKIPFGGKPILDRVRFSGNTIVKRQSINKPKALITPFGSHVRKQFRTKQSKVKTYTPKVYPMAHHKKYSYFLRKRGEYHTSTHHPYGDEHEAYASDPT